MSAASVAMTSLANRGGALSPVPTAVPPEGELAQARQHVEQAGSPELDLPGPSRRLLPERDRRRVHQVGAPGLHCLRVLAGQPAQLGVQVVERGHEPADDEPAGGQRMADGKTSFDDCDAFTSSFGCTGRPSRSDARCASTSFTFMLVEVPDPVWNTSTGNWSSVGAEGHLGRGVVDGAADVASGSRGGGR